MPGVTAHRVGHAFDEPSRGAEPHSNAPDSLDLDAVNQLVLNKVWLPATAGDNHRAVAEAERRIALEAEVPLANIRGAEDDSRLVVDIAEGMLNEGRSL